MRLTAAAASLILFAMLSSHAASEPIFPNSVVSNDLDFIMSSDPGVFACIKYEGRIRAEMPDRRRDELHADGVFSFSAKYKDGTSVGIWVHPDVGSRDAARKLALQSAGPVGKLPTIMRSKLDHVVIHQGGLTAYAEDKGRFFVLYSGNMARRLRNNDLEETVFHEAVHATMDYPMSASAEWKRAQRADGDFVTEYARERPDQEDMAESALFAWALLFHPGRLPGAVEERVRKIMPNRLAFFRNVFVERRPTFYRVGPAESC
ncbi:MAG: hypothetical protein F4213_16250 [Boseongicola sp. SB0677_bin_26]|nr:hypothetical protein [Boseongicola sp. SB0665_bin_10]MYG27543.1 hypothetical protein [Boseongicola sp. SB0677_bin_26]